MSHQDGGRTGRDRTDAPVASREQAAPRTPGSLVWKSISIALGSLLILIGVAGLVLPGIQGILTIIAGLALLSPHSRWARHLMQMIKDRIHRVRGRHKSP